MRTTVELPQGQHQILHAIALKKGYRGFSKVIQEAISFFIHHKKELQSERLELLRLKGSWGSLETKKVRRRIQDARQNWKT